MRMVNGGFLSQEAGITPVGSGSVSSSVMPAQAGIQSSVKLTNSTVWISASAGVTTNHASSGKLTHHPVTLVVDSVPRPPYTCGTANVRAPGTGCGSCCADV